MNFLGFFYQLPIKFAVLIGLVYGTAALSAPLMFIQRYRDPESGRNYNVVSILQRGEDSEEMTLGNPDLSYSPDYVRKLMDYLEKWVPEAYIHHRIIERDGELHKSLVGGTESIKDGKSLLVFVTEENDLSKILAFVRLDPALQGRFRAKIALERRLNGAEVFFPNYGNLAPLSQSRVQTAGFAELKHFLNMSRGPNFLSVILMQVIQSGLFAALNDQQALLLPRYFVIETHPAGMRYFSQLGFRSIHSESKLIQIPESLDLESRSEFRKISNFMAIDLLGLLSASHHEELGKHRHVGKMMPSDPHLYRTLQWKVPRNFLAPQSFPTGCENPMAAAVPFFEEVGDNGR